MTITFHKATLNPQAFPVLWGYFFIITNYICIEKEKECFDIACDRINQPREYSELEIEIKELNKPEFKQLSLLDLI